MFRCHRFNDCLPLLVDGSVVDVGLDCWVVDIFAVVEITVEEDNIVVVEGG